MQRFTVKIGAYLLLFLGIIAIGILLPPVQTNNILFSLQDKHRLIDSMQKAHPDAPLLYWVGGSNVNFGLDSKRISDSLGIPCLNTAVHGGLGLKFQVNNALRYSRKGDIVVLMPEYENFWDFSNQMADGQCELLHTILDVFPEGKYLIEASQCHHLTMYLPRYLHDKYVSYFPTNYLKRNKKDLGAYVRNNYNANGDAILHLDRPAVPFMPMPTIGAPVNQAVLDWLAAKVKAFGDKGVNCLVLYPAYQQTSYQNNEKAIQQLNLLMQSSVPLVGVPERYVFADSLFYDTYYHLNREGREIRSIFVAQDLRNRVAKTQ